MLMGKSSFTSSKVHASTSITLQAYRVLAGSSCQAYHSQNPKLSRKVQVTLPLSFCHELKLPKVIESDIPWHFSGGLFSYFMCLNTNDLL